MPATSSPLVSIVIPCHNAERFVRQAIESVLGQDYDRLEVVAVDDGSTDNTCAIARSFGSRVTCISQPNRGPSAARNLGVRHASGDIIQFLDADDVLHKRRISLLMQAWRTRPQANYVGSSFALVSDELSASAFAVQPLEVDKPKILEDTLSVSYLPAMGLFRRSFIQSIGPWNETLTRWVDLEFHARIAANNNSPFLFVELPLYGYRQHDGPRISNHNKNHSNLDEALRSLTAAEEQLAKNSDLYVVKKYHFFPMYLHLARGYARAGQTDKFQAMLIRASALSTRVAFRHKARAASAFARLFGARAASNIMERFLPPVQ